MNLEVCLGLNIVSHTRWGEQALFCVLISSFQEQPWSRAEMAPERGMRQQEQTPEHEKAQPSQSTANRNWEPNLDDYYVSSYLVKQQWWEINLVSIKGLESLRLESSICVLCVSRGLSPCFMFLKG